MSDETPRRNECREWTCPLHGVENQRLDSELIGSAAEDDPDKIAAFKRLFPTAETYTVEAAHTHRVYVEGCFRCDLSRAEVSVEGAATE